MASSVTVVNTTWATPVTWAVYDDLTASLMNAQLRDKLNALHTPAGAYSLIDEADYTTTSTSFVDIDSTDLAHTFTSGGGIIIASFTGSFLQLSGLNTTKNYLNLMVDGADFFGGDGIGFFITVNPVVAMVSFNVPIYGLAAGSHTIKMRWKVSTGTLTLYAGTGTPAVHPPFHCWEI